MSIPQKGTLKIKDDPAPEAEARELRNYIATHPEGDCTNWPPSSGRGMS